MRSALLSSAMVLLLSVGLFADQSPVPLVNQPLVPASAKPLGPGFTLTVNGSNFVSGALVKWNSSPRTTTFISNSQLQATIPASDIAKPGTAMVTVTNPGNGSPTSGPAFFDVTFGTPIFQTGSVFTYGNGIPALSADLNNDGNLDLVSYSDDVLVLLGNGNGTFKPLEVFSTPCSPLLESVAIGDFNGDGVSDIAIACYDENTGGGFAVLLGDGNGNFHAGPLFDSGTEYWDIVVADFNGDGKLDIASANNGSGGGRIALGNGDGTFGSSTQIGEGFATKIQLGDFNGDGNLDLTLNDGFTTNLQILLGNGDGTFRTGPTLSSGGNLNPIVADFNKDGNLDVATLDGANLIISLGNGDGTFFPPIEYPAGGAVFTMVTGDLNGDGDLDLLTADLNTNSLSVFLGKGDGTFDKTLGLSPGQSPRLGSLGDFNNDGRLDIAFTGQSGEISILPQSPLFLSSTAVTFPDQTINTTSPPQKLVVANVGKKPITITKIAPSGDFGQSNNCMQNGGTLPIGSTCAINLTFTPTMPGTRAGGLSITDDAFTSPQQVSLVGTGTVTSFSPTQLVFPDTPVGSQSDPESVTLTNVGSVPLLIGGVHIRGGNLADFYISSNTCGKGIPAGGQCTVSVFFKPLAKGKRTSNLNFTDNGGASPQSVPLGGKGT
jgi:hypothetical protein